MNFPFIVVLVAAIGGLASELALRNVAPESGPVLALVLMAAAVLVGARLLGRAAHKPARSVVEAPVVPHASAGESLNPA